MKKIPVKIIEVTSPSGIVKKGVMLDVQDYLEFKKDTRSKIKEFEKLYFQLITKAEKLFYGKNSGLKKKYRRLPSSAYWKLGCLLRKFDQNVKNEFIITNFVEALFRDFGLSKDYVYDLLTISKIFKKNEILDSVPFSYYRALKRKYSELNQLKLVEKEKKRLNDMGKKNILPGREKYKIELIQIIDQSKKLSRNKKIRKTNKKINDFF